MVDTIYKVIELVGAREIENQAGSVPGEGHAYDGTARRINKQEAILGDFDGPKLRRTLTLRLL